MPERKAKIIEAAKKSFSLFGFKATTVDQIAKIAKVGKGTIYLYFQNKEELLQEIVHSLIADMKRLADEAIANAKADASFPRLHAGIYALLLYRKEHELLIKIAQEGKEFGSEIAQTMHELIESEIIDYIQLQLQQVMDTGKLKPCDPKMSAFVIYKIYTALVFEWEKTGGELPDEQIADLLKLYVMDGLAVRS